MSNEIVVAQQKQTLDAQVAGLGAMVARASRNLAEAKSPAERLDALAKASFAYDAHKVTGRAASRMGMAKEDYDEVMLRIYRTQADALEIEAMAKRKIADAYDAAVEANEVLRPGQNGSHPISDRNSHKMSQADFGVSSVTMHRAKIVRDAEDSSPGIVRDVLDTLLEQGVEPTKAALSREINTRLGSYSGDNEWYTPARYVEMARDVMGTIDVDPASNDRAQATVQAAAYYTAENSGLDKQWCGKLWMNPPYSNPEVQQFTEKAVDEYLSGNITEAVVLTNNSGDTAWHHALAEASTAMCITRGRIRFESPTRSSNSPAMGQSFFYLGRNVARFAEVFSEIGRITTNYPVAAAQSAHGNDNTATSQAA